MTQQLLVDLLDCLPVFIEVHDELLEVGRPEDRGLDPLDLGHLRHGVVRRLHDPFPHLLHALRPHQGEVDSRGYAPQGGGCSHELLPLLPERERGSIVVDVAEAVLPLDGGGGGDAEQP